MIGLYSSEKLERIGFYGQLLLSEKQREIESINANLEHKVNKRTQQLNIAKEKAEESDKFKSAFLANMSHEIRTPMNAVIGFSALLEDEDLSEDERTQYLSFIKSNGESLIKIIDDIIDISKIEAQQFKVDMHPFNLLELMDELKQFYTNFIIIKKPGLELKCEIDENLRSDQLINSDKIRLKQVISNLLNNAIKYTKSGEILLICKIKASRLQFSISDTGLGIPEKITSKIFERFYQYSDEFISRHQGTGLGLPISNEIIKLLGGTLSFESVVNKGTTFVFDIPLEIKSNGAPEASVTLLTDKESLGHKKILIVDDEESNFVLTRRVLRDTKVKMDWAENGVQAVQMVSNCAYDLILMDIKMPQMDGIETTELIRSTGNDVIIVMQTAFAETPVKNRAFSAGCNDFIVKPLQLESFKKLVNKYLHN
jgi:signal transduction histidine kinase